MKKKLSTKQIGIVASAAVVIVAAVIAGVVFLGQKEESYRSIRIYELNGTATIQRENIGEVDAVENLYLDSGDRIFVGADSTMRLKLDEDKYILVEENSILSIVAEGTSADSKTSIHLEQGAITNEIQNPLSENSTYNVSTPNSVMAVRGTVFRVEVLFDEAGEVYTKVSTFEGSVGSSLILPDGTRQVEVLFIEGGTETLIRMSEEITEYVVMPQEIDYRQTPVTVLEFLQEISEERRELPGITTEIIQQLIVEIKEAEALAEEIEGNEEPSTEEESETEDVTAEEAEEEATNVAGPKKEQNNNEAMQTGEEAEREPETEELPVEETLPTTPAEESASSESNSSDSGSSSGSTITYTVTFMYNGTVFGTQTVQDGQLAVAPKLAPAATGKWNFDFSTPIHGNVTITWN
ncbi:MAG: FecR domain-containing protein [Agathobacter sp.]